MPPFKELTEPDRKFLMTDADRFVANFDGEPKDAGNQKDVDEVSLGGTLQAYLAYFAIPEQAGNQVMGFLDNLPRDNDIPNAFIRIRVLLEVRNRLAQIVGDAVYLKKMNRMPGDQGDAAVEAENKRNPITPLDKIIERSARDFDDKHEAASDADIADSLFDGATSEEIDREIFESARTVPQSENLLDFSGLDPNVSFQNSVKVLTDSVIRWVIEGYDTIRAHNVMKKREIAHISNQIRVLSTKLPLPNSGRDHAL